MCSLCFSRVYGCAICSIPLLFVFLHMRMSSNPWSIAGVSLNLVGILGLPYHCAPLVCVPVAALHSLSARTHTDFFYCILFFPSVFPFKTGREILHTTCVRFCCNWHAVCVAVKHQKKINGKEFEVLSARRLIHVAKPGRPRSVTPHPLKGLQSVSTCLCAFFSPFKRLQMRFST